MLLIGQYDSPFVRRVGIALSLYAIPFTHRPWSVFGDAERIRAYNPLVRVPTLVLDDGEALLDSHAIVDHLDSLVPADRALLPRTEPARRRASRVVSLAIGTADKAVSLFYERRLHEQVSEVWFTRCRRQVDGGLDALEAERSRAESPYWFGDCIGHADIAVAVMLRFVREAHPGVVDTAAHPALVAFSERLETLPVFREVQQPFAAPA